MKFKKIIYINIFLLIISCSDDISSSPSNEILIVSSPEDSLYAAPFIEDFLKSQNFLEIYPYMKPLNYIINFLIYSCFVDLF